MPRATRSPGSDNIGTYLTHPSVPKTLDPGYAGMTALFAIALAPLAIAVT